MRRKAHVVAGFAGIATAAGLVALMAPGQEPQPSRGIEVAPLRPIAVEARAPTDAAPSSAHRQLAVEEAITRPPRPVSDALVRSLVETLSDHPMLASWLATDGLLRRFASAVEAVAGGYSPREALRPLAPHRGFVVTRSGEELVVAPSSYRRYDLVADVVGSVDAVRAVEVYLRLEPEIAAAHHQIAWYQEDFRSRMVAAIDHLLEVDPPEGDVAVRRGAVTYAFADPTLEALTDAQRQLLRMGPRNAAIIQAKLREIRSALEPLRATRQSPGTAPTSADLTARRRDRERMREPAAAASQSAR